MVERTHRPERRRFVRGFLRGREATGDCRRVNCEGVELYQGCDFSAADFFDLDFLANLLTLMGESSVSEETINATTLVVVPPTPLGEPFFHKKTWNMSIVNNCN